jgi:hypothetical protein
MKGKGMGTADPLRLISLPNIPLPIRPGATKRRHWRIMAYIAKIPQPTVGTIYKSQNPCKY